METAETNALSDLIARHCVTIKKIFADFRTHYRARAMGAPPGEDALTTLHTLKGSCGTIGFQELHRQIAVLHEHLKAWPAETTARYRYERQMASEIAETAEMIENIRPEDSSLYGRVL